MIKSKDYYKPTICGIGFIGIGKYKSRIGNGKNTKVYDVWSSMIKRCYSEKYHRNKPTYIGCSVVKEWHRNNRLD